MKTVRVLGIPIDIVNEIDALEFIRERIGSGVQAHIVTVNAEYVMYARSDSAFRDLIERAALRTADSEGVVLAARRRGGHVSHRVGGSDMIWSIAEQAARLGHRLYLIGSAPGVAQTTATALEEKYPGLVIAGTRSGSPQTSDDNRQIAAICETNPDIVLVAFGSPEQDYWIDRVRSQIPASILIGVGGSFDYVARVAQRAPRWMRRARLEWLWRLLREPWRWRRMLVLPQFAILALVRGD